MSNIKKFSITLTAVVRIESDESGTTLFITPELSNGNDTVKLKVSEESRKQFVVFIK